MELHKDGVRSIKSVHADIDKAVASARNQALEAAASMPGYEAHLILDVGNVLLWHPETGHRVWYTIRTVLK